MTVASWRKGMDEAESTALAVAAVFIEHILAGRSPFTASPQEAVVSELRYGENPPNSMYNCANGGLMAAARWMTVAVTGWASTASNALMAAVS